jgi:hypothetical protein
VRQVKFCKAPFWPPRVEESQAALRAAAPDTGAYLNECDYFQGDWQKSF